MPKKRKTKPKFFGEESDLNVAHTLSFGGAATTSAMERLNIDDSAFEKNSTSEITQEFWEEEDVFQGATLNYEMGIEGMKLFYLSVSLIEQNYGQFAHM